MNKENLKNNNSEEKEILFKNEKYNSESKLDNRKALFKDKFNNIKSKKIKSSVIKRHNEMFLNYQSSSSYE